MLIKFGDITQFFFKATIIIFVIYYYIKLYNIWCFHIFFQLVLKLLNCVLNVHLTYSASTKLNTLIYPYLTILIAFHIPQILTVFKSKPFFFKLP